MTKATFSIFLKIIPSNMTRVESNRSNKRSPIICSAYFRETPAKDYSFLGFYQYRQKQPDFTYSFQKEALKLKNDLNVLVKGDSEEVKTAVSELLQKYKAHREKYNDVRIFWNKIESSTADSDLHLDKVKTARTVMHGAERLIKTAFNEVDSTLKTDGGYVSNNEPNERKRPAEEASPIITPPPKLRSYAHTFSPCYKSGDNSFDDYDEESTEASTDVSPLNLANVDTPDYETTTRECSSDEMGESSENNIPNDSDFNETIEIKHDDLEELERQITFSLLNEWEVGTVNVSRKFKEYQRQLIASIRRRETKLTWNNTFELLALSSIIVMCWPCPYSTFTSSEWRKVLNSNPHKITQPILTDSLLTTFYKATNDFSLGLNYSFVLNDDSELDEKAYRIFNYIKDELPVSSKRKETENKHSVYYLDPFIKIIFGGEYTPYTLELNKSVNGKQRPDFSCVIDDIAILNSEIKPLGYTQLRKNQDFVKVHLKGKKSINKLLEKGGPNRSTAFLNMGDTIESYFIDLAYDGVYRSWPCLKNKLATDKGSFPLIVLTFSHFVIIERHVSEIMNDYENRPPPGSYTPTEQIEKAKFIRKMPTTPQLKLLLKQ